MHTCNTQNCTKHKAETILAKVILWCLVRAKISFCPSMSDFFKIVTLSKEGAYIVLNIDDTSLTSHNGQGSEPKTGLVDFHHNPRACAEG